MVHLLDRAARPCPAFGFSILPSFNKPVKETGKSGGLRFTLAYAHRRRRIRGGYEGRTFPTFPPESSCFPGGNVAAPAYPPVRNLFSRIVFKGLATDVVFLRVRCRNLLSCRCAVSYGCGSLSVTRKCHVSARLVNGRIGTGKRKAKRGQAARRSNLRKGVWKKSSA